MNVSGYREECVSFEDLDFGAKSARSLSGHVWVGTKDDSRPCGDVQVAARSTATGTLVYIHSAADGTYELKLNPGEEYDVWTCLDGFDELRFRFTIDSSSNAEGVDLYVGPSEAPGWRDVVLKSRQ